MRDPDRAKSAVPMLCGQAVKQNATDSHPWRFVLPVGKSGRSPNAVFAQRRTLSLQLTGLRPKPGQRPKRQRLHPKQQHLRPRQQAQPKHQRRSQQQQRPKRQQPNPKQQQRVPKRQQRR
jgi:hypothetical protein